MLGDGSAPGNHPERIVQDEAMSTRARRPSDVAAEAESLRHNIARNVRRLRGSRTRAEVAAAAGIGPVMLYRIETARRMPSLETLVRLAGALGLPNATFLLLPPPLALVPRDHAPAEWLWAYLALSGPGKREAQRRVAAMARDPYYDAAHGRRRPRRLARGDGDAGGGAAAGDDERPGGRGIVAGHLEHDGRGERERREAGGDQAVGHRVTSSSWSGNWPPVRWSVRSG